MKNVKQRISIVAGLSFAAAVLAAVDVHGANPGPANGVPSDHLQVRLIQNALIALNHAQLTGNYTVLRDFCSPQMREQHKASDLSRAFGNAHDRNRDMSLVMEMKPMLSQRPTFSADGRLRLVGYFPTHPLVLHFDLVFLKTDTSDWSIDGIVVRTEQARPPTTANRRP